MAFRARRVFGSFEKRTPGLKEQNRLPLAALALASFPYF